MTSVIRTERALRLTLDKRHSSGFSYCKIRLNQHNAATEYAKGTYFIEERLNLLLFLALTDLVRVRDLEELRCHFDQPLWFYRGHVVAVFAGGKNEFVVYQPFRPAIE